MKAVIVYESHWGNTEAIARAIVEGYGPDAVPLTTDDATPATLADAEVIVAGAPVLGFSLPTTGMVERLDRTADRPPDVSHEPLRTWLERLPRGHARHAAFETRIRWSPGGATGAISRAFEAAGYRKLGDAQRFIVKGTYGPLLEGEAERARTWGADLARTAAESLTERRRDP